MDAPGARAGLFGSLKRSAAALIGLLHARVQLLGTELREEQQRLLGAAALGILGLLLLQAGVLFVGLLAVALWGEERRVLALAVVAAVFVAGGGLAIGLARRRLQRDASPFAASLAELERDRDALRGAEPPA